MLGDQLTGFGRLAGAALRADLALRKEQPTLPMLLCVLLVGPLILLALLGAGLAMRPAMLASVTGGCCALWMLRSLPVHFAPLLALLLHQLFLVESGAGLMSGLGLDVFWWMLGSLMLALAAWETGLIALLISSGFPGTPDSTARRSAVQFIGHLLAGFVASSGTRAASNLSALQQRESRACRFADHLGRMVGLPSHVLNLFLVGLLAPMLVEQLSVLAWAAMMLVPAVVLAALAACAPLKQIEAAGTPSRVNDVLPRRQCQLSTPQLLSGLALMLAWLGAAFSSRHGLPPGVLCLYLGLMVVAAGLLPVEKLAGGIDWGLLLACGIWIGLTRTVGEELRAPLAQMIGNSTAWLHPIVAVAALIALVCLIYRYAGLLRSGLILLPMVKFLIMVAAPQSSQMQTAAGSMMIVLLTLHWLDISSVQASRTRAVRIAVTAVGFVVIAATGAVWHRLGLL
ncbi:hypothetical protein BH11PSE11_BH11PSE11_21400 [soil metagenome]